jgi:tripartite-type tricarboxylate transporter receptor subunit TctC
MNLKRVLVVLIAVTVWATLSCPAVFGSEEKYPNRPIEIIISFPPGGPVDMGARALQVPLQTALGVPITLTNKGGAGGALATDFVSKAKPDGYTILHTSTTPLTIVPNVNPAITYKISDFAPVCVYSADWCVITAKPGAPWKTLEELIDYAKKNPGKLNYATTGMGTTPYFVFELFKLHYDLDIVPVQFQGSAPVKNAILGGHTDLAAAGMSVMIPLLKAGSITGLVTSAPKRLTEFPNIPTMAEKGFPDASMNILNGLFVPQKTPKAVVERLSKEMAKIVKDHALLTQLERSELFFYYRDGAETLKLLERDFNSIAKVVKKVGVGK